MKYRKKPVVIEAVQWIPDEMIMQDVIDLFGGIKQMGATSVQRGKDGLQINTLEGVMNVSPGDYIIKGVQGELYPCKPDIFEQTYELVE